MKVMILYLYNFMELDEFIIVGKEREQNLVEQIDEIVLFAKEWEENIIEQIDDCCIITFDIEENSFV